MLKWGIAALALLGWAGAVWADDLPPPDENQLVQVVEAIHMAELVPSLCPGIVEDKQVVKDFIDMGPIPPEELSEDGRFGNAIKGTEAQFRADYAKDAKAACDGIYAIIGGDIGMLKRTN